MMIVKAIKRAAILIYIPFLLLVDLLEGDFEGTVGFVKENW